MVSSLICPTVVRPMIAPSAVLATPKNGVDHGGAPSRLRAANRTRTPELCRFAAHAALFIATSQVGVHVADPSCHAHGFGTPLPVRPMVSPDCLRRCTIISAGPIAQPPV